MESKRRSEKLLIQQRDVVIFKFLDRVGYAKLSHIAIAVGTDGSEKAQAAILRRLYLLRRFGYLKVFSTHQGNYYALENKAAGNNALIRSIKLDQLEHHDFLTKLFFIAQNEQVVSEREAIATFKVVGKRGKVPDMVINDWVIEYERTNKSVADCKAVVEYWTAEQGKNLCIIYDSEQIKNRYLALINPRVKLLARESYQNILLVLAGSGNSPGNNSEPNSENTHKDSFLENIKNKYL